MSLEGEDVGKEAGKKQMTGKQPLGAAGSPGWLYVFTYSPALVGSQLPTSVFKPKYYQSHCVEAFLQL